MRRQFASEDWIQIHYEELATQPASALNTLCQFLAISYEPNMLKYRHHPYMGIRGNRMAENSQSEDIVFDQKWKKELSSLNQAKFMLFGGALNHYLGYRG